MIKAATICDVTLVTKLALALWPSHELKKKAVQNSQVTVN